MGRKVTPPAASQEESLIAIGMLWTGCGSIVGSTICGQDFVDKRHLAACSQPNARQVVPDHTAGKNVAMNPKRLEQMAAIR